MTDPSKHYEMVIRDMAELWLQDREALDMALLTLRQIAGQNVDKELFRYLAVVTLVRITEVLGEDE